MLCITRGRVNARKEVQRLAMHFDFGKLITLHCRWQVDI
jgi:hypothetical protein